ncbi:MAG: type II secretion system F family protein [Treponema sp.]|nr:type II secretion system F family protein [Treponema sp.]
MKQSIRFSFTQALSELLISGVSLYQACAALSQMKQVNKRLRAVAYSVQQKLFHGESVCDALLKTEQLFVPRWYRGVLLACERSGSLHKAFSFLHELENQLSQSRERICAALLYPVFIVVLALSGTVLLILKAPDLFPAVDSQFYSTVFGEVLFALLFFIPSAFVLCLFVFSAFSVDEFLLVCIITEFLLSERMSLFEALEQSLYVCKSGSKLEKTLCESLQLLREGYSPVSALESLHPSMGMYLRIAEQTGNLCNAFSQIKQAISSEKKRKQTVCLSLLEPSLILITGMYIAILLKQIFLPLLFAWSI